MTTTMASYQTTWNTVMETIDLILNDRPFTAKSYFQLCDSIHQYLNSPEYQNDYIEKSRIFQENEKRKAAAAKKAAEEEAKQPKGTPKAPVEPDINEQNESNIPGGHFYYNIKVFLQQHLEKVAQNEGNLQGEDFLRFYGKAWNKYQLLSKFLDGLFWEMNSLWISRQRQEGRTYIHKIFVLAMNLWNRAFFEKSTQILTQKCLDLIEKHRHGERLDKFLIKSVIQSYIFVGASAEDKQTHLNNNTLRLYQEHFEREFLQATEKYYRVKVLIYRTSGTTKDYIDTVLRRLHEEEERVPAYLHETTRTKLLPIVENILISDQIKEIQNEAIGLIRSESISALTTLYQLTRRVQACNEPIQQEFERYIHEIAMDAMNGVKETAVNDPKIYVEKILEVYRRFDEILEKAFLRDAAYKKSLDSAFGRFVNDNAVTQATQAKKSAELVARYCDVILRKGEKAVEGGKVDEKLDEIMIVFNYIEDKDVFQSFYGKLLAKRLVGQASASIEWEELMITKLKTKCGQEYTAKIQHMFEDVRGSTTFCEKFREHLKNGESRYQVDVSTMILSSSFWPLSPCDTYTLPREILALVDRFTAFYLNSKPGRRLSWTHQHSKCEIHTNFTSKKYIIQISIYQAAILFLFNQLKPLTISQIQDQTSLKDDIFLPVLLGLIQSKIIKCAEIPPTTPLANLKESDLQPNYTVQLASNYKNERIKFNLIQPLRAVEQREVTQINQQTDEERKILTELALVRVMKARKTLSHKLLVEEVIPQLSPRFRPEKPKIKKCIDLLIEREFIKRDETQKDLYIYLA